LEYSAETVDMFGLNKTEWNNRVKAIKAAISDGSSVDQQLAETKLLEALSENGTNHLKRQVENYILKVKGVLLSFEEFLVRIGDRVHIV
jgi:hypothetical protein